MSQKIDSGKTIQEKATVLWDVANSLSGLYKPHEYGLVILPMAVVKRFHDYLLPTHAKVQKVFAAKKHLQVREGFLKAASVETPLGDSVAENRTGRAARCRGRVKPDVSKRDTENVPLGEDLEEYLKREVLPYNPSAYIDHAKSKVGYEIPFTRTFYEFKPVEPSEVIAKRICEHEKNLMAQLHKLFGEGK